MKSFDRPDEEAVGVCTKCGKALAREEVVMVDGKVMCAACAPQQESTGSGAPGQAEGTQQDQHEHEQQLAHNGSRRLYRSRKNQVIGGVAAGVAEYFDIDPTIVRIAWALLAIAWGTGILIYLICGLVIPIDPSE